MIVSKVASIRIVAFALILAAACQPVRAEEVATQHASNSAGCARSTFRVLIDVGPYGHFGRRLQRPRRAGIRIQP